VNYKYPALAVISLAGVGYATRVLWSPPSTSVTVLSEPSSTRASTLRVFVPSAVPSSAGVTLERRGVHAATELSPERIAEIRDRVAHVHISPAAAAILARLQVRYPEQSGWFKQIYALSLPDLELNDGEHEAAMRSALQNLAANPVKASEMVGEVLAMGRENDDSMAIRAGAYRVARNLGSVSAAVQTEAWRDLDWVSASKNYGDEQAQLALEAAITLRGEIRNPDDESAKKLREFANSIADRDPLAAHAILQPNRSERK
jgi:hypothetical protein